MPDATRDTADLTVLLQADYAKGHVLDRIPPRPRLADASALIDLLTRLILPSPADLDSLSALTEEVLRVLTEQISLALGTDFPPAVYPPDVRAHALSADFLSALPELRALLLSDLNAAFEGDPAAASPEEIALCYPGFHALLVHRMAHRLHAAGVPLLPRLMAESAHARTGIDIHPGASIGRACFIDHGTGVVIGDHVKLYHGVTLGALSTRGGQSLRGRKRHPTLGDRVTIYAGASVLGGDTHVGDGAVIGARALVTSSVPAGARILPSDGAVPLASGGN